MDFFRGFKAPSKFAQEILFFTDGLGHLKSEDFYISRKSFNNNLIMYVLSGKLHVEQNGHNILRKGEGIIMRLTEKHKYYTDPIDTCEVLWMHFSGRQSEIFMKYLEQKYMLPAVFKEEKVAQLIKNCFSIYNNSNSENEFLISQNIYSIILTIVHSVCYKNEQININPQTEFVNKAIDFIDRNLYKRVTLEQMANYFNISQFHFCKVFQKYFNVTPMKYVLMKKVESSKYMLAYTHQSISDIALSLGFFDQSHYSKTFKSFYGISPIEYRKSVE